MCHAHNVLPLWTLGDLRILELPKLQEVGHSMERQAHGLRLVLEAVKVRLCRLKLTQRLAPHCVLFLARHIVIVPRDRHILGRSICVEALHGLMVPRRV